MHRSVNSDGSSNACISTVYIYTCVFLQDKLGNTSLMNNKMKRIE